MKVVFRIDKDGNYDSFFYPGPGKVPPFIPPLNRNEPKDGAPPEPPKDDKPKPN
jgi:hypothetical protein